jgi:ribosomal protein S6--L-glutamate ligase
MDIGVVTVRDDSYHPNRRLMEAAEKRGCSLCLVDPYRCGPWIANGGLKMGGEFSGDLPQVILPRQGAQIGVSSLTVLSHFEAMGLKMVNTVGAIRIASSKFLSLQALAAKGIRVPDTVFANSARLFYAGIEYLGGFPLVVKKLSSRQGKDVFLMENSRDADQMVIRHLEPASGLLIQHFISPESRSDIRVMVINGKIAGAMELAPPPGDFRSNYHVSGQSSPARLTDEICRMALGAARSVGLDIAGIDIILDAEGVAWVMEVNYSPGFKGLEAATGKDIALEIIDFCLC